MPLNCSECNYIFQFPIFHIIMTINYACNSNVKIVQAVACIIQCFLYKQFQLHELSTLVPHECGFN